MTRKKMVFWIICLVLADQVVKLFVVNFFIDTKFYVIEPIFGFRPVFNDQFSYFNAILKLNLGLLPHAILLIFIQFLFLFYYGYYRTAQHSSKLLDISFIFGQSGLVCVFCGFFLWKKGVLDYIYLYLFTVDLKDIYLNCFAVLFLLSYHKNKEEIKNSDIKPKAYLLKSWIEFKQFFKNGKDASR